MADDNASKPPRKPSASKKPSQEPAKKAAAKKQASSAPAAKKAAAKKQSPTPVAKRTVAKKTAAKKTAAKKTELVDPIVAALNEAMAAQHARRSRKTEPAATSRRARPEAKKTQKTGPVASPKRPSSLLIAVAALAVSAVSVGFALYQRSASSDSSCVSVTSSIREFMKENPDKAVINETQRDEFLVMKNNVADKCSYSSGRLILETEVAAWLGAPTDLSQVTAVPSKDTTTTTSTSTTTASQPAGR
jgi:hypothetical protein